jgi:hypothetical protein
MSKNKSEITLRKTILEIVKYALFSIEPDLPTNVNWNAVYMEMIGQGIIGLSNDIVSRLDLEEVLAEEWTFTLLSRMRHYLTLGEKQNEIAEILKEHNIDFAVIKGTAAATYYPNPEYRQMGDIDIIVAPHDFERARVLLEDNNCKYVEDTGRHISYLNDSVSIELHRYFSLEEDNNSSLMENQMIYKALNHVKWITINDITFPMLPDFENGLVLLIHLSQHIREGIGLRHIIDWLMFANARLDDKLWNESFAEVADILGLRSLAVTVTRMGQLYMGLPTDNMKWCMEADDKLCAELLNQIFICGNYSLKHEGKVANAVIYGKETSFLRNLEDNGLRNWKAGREHTWLQPFAWLYQIGYYINKYRHLNTFKEAVVGVRNVKSRTKVLGSLGIKL